MTLAIRPGWCTCSERGWPNRHEGKCVDTLVKENKILRSCLADLERDNDRLEKPALRKYRRKIETK